MTALDVRLAPADPWDLVAAWLPANDDPDRPTMTLATVSGDGWPNARTVLLSEWDRDGFYFHTDARSAKVAEADATGRAALVVHLPADARQLVVQGAVERASAEEEARAYAARTAYLRTLAWLNTDDFAARPDAERLAAWAAQEQTPKPPSTWTGRRVRPTRLLFWSGSEETASRRVEYRSEESGWEVRLRAG